MNKDELIALDDRGIGAWDTHDVDSFAAMFADDFVYTDDTVEGTAPGRYLQHSDLDDRASFDPRHIRLPRGGAISLCCSAAATRPWRPAHTPRPSVGQIGSQSRAEEVRCSTHHNEKRRWSRPGCSRRARRCRARRGSRRQPSGGHRLVALRLDLDRKHRAQLGNAREQVRIEVQRGIVAGGDDLPQLPLRATVSIRLRATEIRRCQAPWRRPPQSP
jgi:hypothetical protein